MSVVFENYSLKVKGAMNDACIAFLHEACGELASRAKRNTRVDSGQTKGAWEYEVFEHKLEGVIGNTLENSIWEEFGTGIYAINGDGRKTPWAYKDKDGVWHFTRGKTPSRAFQHAFDSLKGKLPQALANKLRRLR